TFSSGRPRSDAVSVPCACHSAEFSSRINGANLARMKRPWEIGKAFDGSAPCGALQPASKNGHPSKGRIALKANGKLRQEGELARMVWNVPEVIGKLSEMVALAAGDIIMTGTPSGVAATVPGDTLECEIEGVGSLTVTIGPPAR